MKKTVRFLTVLSLSFLLLSSSTPAKAQNMIQRYADKYHSIAEALAHEFGIPRAIIMGVAIVESSAGQARNCHDLKNHFGIVGKNNVPRRTRYKQYGSVEESFRDFCRLISGKSFYKSLRGKTDPKAWTQAIAETGYSEQPRVWSSRVEDVMQTHQL